MINSEGNLILNIALNILGLLLIASIIIYFNYVSMDELEQLILTVFKAE